MKRWPTSEIATIALSAVLSVLPRCGFAATQPNVLMIAVDDMRPELGCYGQSEIVSPNIDGLAQSGRQFNRHYVYAAACGPSRTTLRQWRA